MTIEERRHVGSIEAVEHLLLRLLVLDGRRHARDTRRRWSTARVDAGTQVTARAPRSAAAAFPARSPRATARSSVLRSSRTLPGQSCATQLVERSRRAIESRARRAPSSSMRRRAAAMSSRRSRSGGTRTRHDREAVVEVLAEAAAVRPRAARSRFVAATTRTSTLRGSRLADAADLARSRATRSSFGCSVERQLADLVEEERAAVGALERARRVAIGAGERAAHVAEQLALEQARRDRAAVDDDERLVARAATRCAIASATSSLPVPVSPSMRTVDVASARRARAARRCSRIAQRLADELAEALACARRRQLAHVPSRLHRDRRLTDGEHRADRQDRLLDLRAREEVAVAAAQVTHHDAAAIERQRDVLPRHRRIGATRADTGVASDRHDGIERDLAPSSGPATTTTFNATGFPARWSLIRRSVGAAISAV